MRTDSGFPSVLLIEDDQSLRRVLRLALDKGGFAVTEVASAGDALKLLEKESFYAIVGVGCL